MGILTNRGFTSWTLKIVGTTIKYKKNHRPSGFCTKPLFYSCHQNLNPILK
ncbi:hypothetical protein LEP1GSC044_1584 [Leptospira kirschneri serovar Grippotyphosa str. RM52]|nr:hypothetical protein LEP1GSC044_1584 [Leptospira kirschneri serovar Grippotyphosa str. RM52]EMK07076.1 hypothetical protein LEP1GSC176_3402 [Leptospira kirschneri str. MMD1493]